MRCARYLVVAFLGLAACATLPQPAPVLDGPGKRLSVAVMEGLPYVPTRATVSGPSTAPVTLKQRFEAYESAPSAIVLDPRFSVTHSMGDQLYWSGHVGWWMSGLELRMLPRGSQVDSPVVVAVGAQLDGPALLSRRTDTAIWDVRTQVSVHPRIHGVEMMLGAGLSAGRQKHDLYRPEGPLAHYSDLQLGPLLMRTSRREGRIEGVIGVSFPLGSSRIALTVQPFYVVAQGAVSTMECKDCGDGLHVDSLDASWGAAFTLTWLVSAP
jgi:hypothetical protein